MNINDKTMLLAKLYGITFLSFCKCNMRNNNMYILRNGIEVWKNVVTQTQNGSLQILII